LAGVYMLGYLRGLEESMNKWRLNWRF
jgi:hypothetical protein